MTSDVYQTTKCDGCGDTFTGKPGEWGPGWKVVLSERFNPAKEYDLCAECFAKTGVKHKRK